MPRARAETLTITSSPPGATVEIDGIVVGKTPYTAKFPHGYFRKTITVFERRLEHSMSVRIYKEGFTSQEIKLTEGPFEWVSLNGRSHGHYWLLKSSRVEASLQPVETAFTGTVKAALRGRDVDLRPEIPTAQIVEAAAPAVVTLRNPAGSGSGFLITDTGMIATNRHVAEGGATMSVVLSNGTQLNGNVVYLDRDRDFALVKIDGTGLPFLRLAGLGEIHVGETVVAIGSPNGLQATVTKGIVSAVRSGIENNPGTYIQTDASINHGNSGGPLLDSHGNVIGMNSLRAETDGGGNSVNGIAFALSAEDILVALRKFYPAQTASPTAGEQAQVGRVSFTSEDPGSEIYVDGKFVGQAPATINLPAGPHHVEVRASGRQPWSRDLEVLSDSQLTLHPALAASP